MNKNNENTQHAPAELFCPKCGENIISMSVHYCATPPAERPPQCGTCDGSSTVDSGGVTPWGQGIEVECPECKVKRERPTPETDAEAYYIHMSADPNGSGPIVVDADFARNLERQLAEARRERDNAISDWKQADTDSIRAIHERNEAREQRDRLAAQFTKLDKPKYSGEPMMDKVLSTRNPEFDAWVQSLPPTYWTRYDLSAARIGWEAALASVKETTIAGFNITADPTLPPGTGEIRDAKTGEVIAGIKVGMNAERPTPDVRPMGAVTICRNGYVEDLERQLAEARELIAVKDRSINAANQTIMLNNELLRQATDDLAKYCEQRDRLTACMAHLQDRDWFRDGDSGLVTCTLDADQVRQALSAITP